MKLPKQILVISSVYKVFRQKGLTEKEGLDGYASATEFKIVVDASLKGKALERTFWHEVGHCYAFESGLHQVLNPQSIEMFAESFSAFMVQLAGNRRAR